jgi:hypothetical protein
VRCDRGRRKRFEPQRTQRTQREEGRGEKKKVKLDEERYDGKLNSCNVLNEN